MKSFRGFTFSIKNPLFNIPKIKYYISETVYGIPYDILTILQNSTLFKIKILNLSISK